MKFSLSWLKDYLDTDITADALAGVLNSTGLEVEEVINPAETLKAFTVAEVLEANPHPDADKLRVCRVFDGKEELQIVCGAPNARAGIKVVLGKPGDYVPGLDVTLKKTKIRGVDSVGMMCSLRELELGEDHDGIIELPADAPVGTAYVDYAGLDDPVFDVAITPNRQDCLGIYGIARDLAAAGVGTLKPYTVPSLNEAGAAVFTPTIASGAACMRFAVRSITGVTNGESPAWLKDRLKSVGQKSISKLVDVTNYMTLAFGRPLHVYDADKLSGALTARLAVAGENVEALNGETYTATGVETVIADSAAAQGFGGVIGGALSAVSDETVNVVLEAALFDPVATATTGRTHTINTDSRYRFERGVDPAFLDDGMAIAAAMIQELCGGTVSQMADAGSTPAWAKTVAFNPARVASLGGMQLEDARIQDILTKLGFGVDASNLPWQVSVPSWRSDVDGPADLVEDVLRIEGIDKIASVALPPRAHKAGQTLSERQKRARVARRTLAARGAFEAVTWSFVSRAHAALFGGGSEALVVDNPISSELDCMRPSTLPGLVLAAQRNKDRGAESVSLFEVGPLYLGDGEKDQRLSAGIIRAFKAGARHWSEAQAPFSLYDVRADVEAVLSGLGLDASKLQIFDDAGAADGVFHPGRSGSFRLGAKNIIARFGELHPRLLKAMDVAGPMMAAEIDLDALPAKRRKSTAKDVLALSNLQAVERDFAFVVKADVRVQELLKAVRGADKVFISDVSVFDVYEGKGVEEGHKSLALSVTLTPQDKTLTDADIEAVSAKVIAAAEKSVEAKLRF